MIRHKWIVDLRNQLSNLAGECDSSAAIVGSKLSGTERAFIKDRLRSTIKYIDDKIFK